MPRLLKKDSMSPVRTIKIDFNFMIEDPNGSLVKLFPLVEPILLPNSEFNPDLIYYRQNYVAANISYPYEKPSDFHFKQWNTRPTIERERFSMFLRLFDFYSSVINDFYCPVYLMSKKKYLTCHIKV